MSDASPAPLPAIPTQDIDEALIHLRRPFTVGAVKWKIQASWPKEAKEKKGVTVVGYIDVRLVTARLNAVVGGGQWQEEVGEKVGEHLLRYHLTVLGQTHTDVGEGQGTDTGMKTKATDSDALKRVAVRFGIGEYLYAMPALNFYVTPSEEVNNGKPTVARLKNGKPGYLKAAHEKWIREEYERWLQAEGIEEFGEPLAHGDARSGSVGALAEGLVPPDEIEAGEEDLRPPALEDDKAKTLREQITKNYTELCKINPDRLAQGRLDKMVEDAAHSHDELQRVAVALKHLCETESLLAELRSQLIQQVGPKDAKPLIDSAERRGSQEERIEAMKKALDKSNAPT